MRLIYSRDNSNIFDLKTRKSVSCSVCQNTLPLQTIVSRYFVRLPRYTTSQEGSFNSNLYLVIVSIDCNAYNSFLLVVYIIL